VAAQKVNGFGGKQGLTGMDGNYQKATETVAVRHCSNADIKQIQAIYAHHVANGLASFETTPPSVEELLERHRACLRLNLPFLVAETEKGVVGYSYAGPYRPRPAYRYTIEDSVYIAPAFVGRGIGTVLLAALIRECESGPWRQMVAVIGDSANFGSISLHRKLGFNMIGTIRSAGFKFGRWVDTVLMQRPVGRGDADLPDGDEPRVDAP